MRGGGERERWKKSRKGRIKRRESHRRGVGGAAPCAPHGGVCRLPAACFLLSFVLHALLYYAVLLHPDPVITLLSCSELLWRV